jgi:hypothetical protein
MYRVDLRPSIERRSDNETQTLDKRVRAYVDEITLTKAGLGSRPAGSDGANDEIKWF